MENQVLDVIAKRRSIRSYTEQPLRKDQVSALVDAALISPSSQNQQPWHLHVVQDTALILRWERAIIEHFRAEGNTETVEFLKNRDNKIFYDAPAVFVISAKPNTSTDVGIMAQSIALAAKSMGLDSVILGFPRVVFAPEYEGEWQKTLGFPDGNVYGLSVAVGYGDSPGRERSIDYSKVSYLPGK